jgi:hypothetical protein
VDRVKDAYRLLILDWHVSYVTFEFFSYYLDHKIIPFCLPPHSTHLLKPLDVGLFSTLKRHYSNILDENMQEGCVDTGINKGTFLMWVKTNISAPHLANHMQLSI